MAVSVLPSLRPPFLVLTPINVFLGIALAAPTSLSDSMLTIALILVAALAAHISVNTLNEHHDFRSGLDAKTQRTPFSGGSGALVAHPERAPRVLIIGVVSLGVTASIGLYFVSQHGLPLLALGLLGLFLVVAYTPWLNRSPWLCLIAPGLAFGPVMVIGTQIALTGTSSAGALAAALVPFFLTNNLLLLNQFPDAMADETVGRRHFPIAYGVARSVQVYRLNAALAGASIVAAVAGDALPLTALIALIPLLRTPAIAGQAARFDGDIAPLLPFMGQNVVIALASPALLAAALFLAR